MKPSVSLIIVARNAVQHLPAALASLAAQSYPRERLEIILVDGQSTDGTRELATKLLKQLQRQGWRVQLLVNPRRILASGWNLAIRQARGDIVCRIDAHATIGSDYVKIGVHELTKRRDAGCACVGGVIAANVSETRVGQIVTNVLSSRFGVGNSTFRVGTSAPRETDTAVYGLYWRRVFEEVGYFDETLGRNQDIDLHRRMRARGMAFVTHPDMTIRYTVRSTYVSFARKAWGDGYWIGRSGQSYWRHRVPLAFILYLALLPLAALAFPVMASLPLLAYLTAGIGFAVRDGESWRAKLLLPFFFLTLHVCYGVGTAAGLVARWSARRQPGGVRTTDERAEAEMPRAA